ncbi:MAG: divergent PAP2 family protein [Cyanobacteria bacterium SIG30]|nr:divergent PAP2 family protein [Cyanobacteria bacterium SIG30]
MILNTGYEVLIAGIGGAILAQTLKVMLYFITHKEINFKILTTTGGMPSSHSAVVTGIATSVALIQGFDSVLFAVSTGFAIIIMYDATGIRRAAGKTAATLNRFIREIRAKDQKITTYATLKELLGHTPIEVFWGAILGVIFAYFVHGILQLLLL